MISEKHRFIFIHVPKTAGNSIQNVLRNYSEDELVSSLAHQDGVERFSVRNRKYKTHKHSMLSDYKAAIPSELHDSLFKFATIRNPWERMVSLFFSPAQGRTEWTRAEFLELIHGAIPLRNWICAEPDAHGDLDRDMDVLMRFERIDKDFETVCRKLNIQHDSLRVRNRSVHAHYSTYYDAELKDLVGQRFADEVAFGDYHFEKP